MKRTFLFIMLALLSLFLCGCEMESDAVGNTTPSKNTTAIITYGDGMVKTVEVKSYWR